MKIIIIIQARTTSSRLPNKVMMYLYGKPLLYRIVQRIKKSVYADNLVIATSCDDTDDVIEDFCIKEGINCFRGHSTDLLDRHYKAAKKYKAEAVVKIPSDCPLIDPQIIDRVIDHYLDGEKYDYVSNLHPATYPDGNDVEIFSFKVLEKAWNEADKIYEREHTTPYFWENPDKFRIGNIEWEKGLNYSSTHRWTIDYAEDYLFIKKIYEALYPLYGIFTMDQILDYLIENPELMQINKFYAGSYWYDNHITELKNIKEYKQTKKIYEWD